MKNKVENNYYILSKYRTELMGIAAILVIIAHSNMMISYWDFSVALYYVLGQANIGVDIFFFLSGIGLYFSFSNKKYNFKQYYVKRILNVYVIYLLIAFPLMLFHAIRFGSTVADFFLDWSGISFYLGRQYVYKNHGGWYVMFIMVLYLIYPLIFKVQKYFEKKKTDLFFLIVVIALYIAFCSFFLVKYESVFMRYEVALTRIPIFLIGSYIGKLTYNKEKFGIGTYITIVLGIAVSLLLAYLNLPFISSRFNKTLMAVALCLIYCMLRSVFNFSIIIKLFSFIGKMSLEVYLTHGLANILLFKSGHASSGIQYLIIVAISIPVSYLISRLRLKLVSKYDEKLKTKT